VQDDIKRASLKLDRLADAIHGDFSASAFPPSLKQRCQVYHSQLVDAV
jgi:hypothetical protein